MHLVDRRNLLLCVFIPLGVLAFTWPFADAGVHDDAAYVHMAKTLAATGRFAYNGWGAMTLGIQVWWAAAWIRLLGFSFTVTRLSLLPLALAVVPLVYLLARRARLSATDSLFAALLTAQHEEFLDLAPTFMSDVSSLALLLASLYGFARAVESADSGTDPAGVLRWLLLGMACGALGGTVRQNVWFALLAGPAVLALRPGAGTAARLAASGCFAAGVACLVLGIRWYNAQPYAIPSEPARIDLEGFRQTAGGLPLLTLTALVGCVLPAMTTVAFTLPSLRLRLRPRWLSVTAILLSTTTCLWLQRRALRRLVMAIADASWPDGIGAACDVGIGTLGYLRWLALVTLVLMVSWDLVRRGSMLLAAARRLPAALVVSLAYAALYCAALTQYKTSSGSIFPRYFLVTMPILTCCLLYWVTYRDAGDTGPQVRRSVSGWLLVALTTGYGVLVTHDHFAIIRARQAAVEHLLAEGVPRTSICAGWQIDHWEQIERAGHLNNPRIRTPAGAFQPVPQDGYPHNDALFCRDHSAVITPEYVIDGDPPRLPGDGTVFPVFPCGTWWPKTRGIVTIQHQTRAIPGSGGGGIAR